MSVAKETIGGRKKGSQSKFNRRFTDLLSKPGTRNWVDAFIITCGIASFVGGNYIESAWWQNVLSETTSLTLFYAALSALDRVKGLSGQRLDRISQGTEIIKKSDELTMAFAGQGHDALDALFKSEPLSVVPILDTTEGSETIRTWIQNTRPPEFSVDKHDVIKNSYFISLGLEGKSLVLGDSSNYDLIEFDPNNILTTNDGNKRFITYGFGASFDECLLKQPRTGIPPERYLLSHEHLRNNAISQKSLTIDDESIMVMIDDGTRVMDPPKNEFAKNTFSSRNMIWIDPITTVFSSIRQLYKNKKLLTLNFTAPDESYLENVVLESLGFQWRGDPHYPDSLLHPREFSDDQIEVVFENNDALTIVSSLNKNVKKENGEVVALFRSEIAYETCHRELENAGIKCQCVAIILRDQVKNVQKMLREGDSVIKIQKSLDKENCWEKYQKSYRSIVNKKQEKY